MLAGAVITWGVFHPGYAAASHGPVVLHLRHYHGRLVFSPAVLPPGFFYGFLFAPPWYPVNPGSPLGGARLAGPRKDDEEAPRREEKPSDLRASNAESISRAERFIGFGDAHFRDQRYSDALESYRKAMVAAPGLADARFRQGYAQIALGHFEAATKAFKLGLRADPTWSRSDFENDLLYGANQRAKSAHLEALAEAADKEPANGDLLFLIGIYLYFDGQRERATPFFQRAAQLSPHNATTIRSFLAGAAK